MNPEPSLNREEIALSIFVALLPRALDKADKMAFPEGALNRMKLEIAAAWVMTDLWISERPDPQQNDQTDTST